MGYRGRPLSREIVLVLALKAVAIAVIWVAYFGPATRLVVDDAAIERHVTAASPITPQAPYRGRAR